LRVACAPLKSNKEHTLRHPNDNGFAERRNAAAVAKKQLLAKFESAPKPTDAEMQERLAARAAMASAKEARRAEREAAKKAENERLLAEAASAAAAAQAHEKAEAEAREAEINNRISRVVADEAARKAERDRRYAARKARQG
jgi:membrane protein involved in colicin uptake